MTKSEYKKNFFYHCEKMQISISRNNSEVITVLLDALFDTYLQIEGLTKRVSDLEGK